MHIARSKLAAAVAALWLSFGVLMAQDVKDRWTEQRANEWYDRQPWLVGANYVPSDAINPLEMFQAATFNPTLNDRELGLPSQSA